MKEVLVFVVAFALSIILTPICEALGKKLRIVDTPGGRKVHSEEVPRTGGIAIWSSFALATLVAGVRLPLFWIVPFAVVLAFGFIDDIRSMKALTKLFLQIAVGVLWVTLGGPIISKVGLFSPTKFELGWFALPITVLWFVGLMNAMNLIDGLDGLAAGIGIISLIAMLPILLVKGHSFPAVLALATIGSLAGFLIFNRRPARIFMGDCGSQTLGFVMAAISLSGMLKTITLASLSAPLLIMSVPILDTGFAFLRRIAAGKNPFSPDASHIHHRLARLLGYDAAVLTLYGISSVLAGVGVAVYLSGAERVFILRHAVVWFAVFWLFVSILYLIRREGKK